MMYLDANFFVFCNFDQTSKGKNARKILAQIVAGEKAITSSLALDELMWVIIKNKKIKCLRATIEDIYAIPHLTAKEVAASVPMDALDFIEHGNLKPRDAFHVAIMRNFNTRRIVSDDADFDRVAWINRIKM